MYTAVHFRHEPPGILDKIVGKARQKKVVSHDLLGRGEAVLGRRKVKVDIQVLEERSDGVRVLVLFHLRDSDEITEVVSTAARRVGVFAIENGGGNDVSQEVRARGLDSVEVRGREKHVEQPLECLAEIKVDKERPVQQPCPRLQLGERVGLRVNHVLQVLNIRQRRLPLTRQDVGGELAPVGRER